MKILEDSEIAQTIDVTETEKYRRRYDAAAKKLVSRKAILAYILKSTMEEFQDVSVKQIAEELSEEFYIDMTEEIDQEVSRMCNLSEGIFEKGIQAGIARGMETGMAAGEAIGRMNALFDLVRNGTLTMSVAAEAAAMEPSEFERQYNESL